MSVAASLGDGLGLWQVALPQPDQLLLHAHVRVQVANELGSELHCPLGLGGGGGGHWSTACTQPLPLTSKRFTSAFTVLEHSLNDFCPSSTLTSHCREQALSPTPHRQAATPTDLLDLLLHLCQLLRLASNLQLGLSLPLLGQRDNGALPAGISLDPLGKGSLGGGRQLSPGLGAGHQGWHQGWGRGTRAGGGAPGLGAGHQGWGRGTRAGAGGPGLGAGLTLTRMATNRAM